MSEKINTFLEEIKRMVDTEIESALVNNEPLIDGLYKSAAYSAGGGKRVRAVFTNLVGNMFGIKKEAMHKTACAVELIHAASLIMDDLPYMDDSQLRRGKPSNHVVFGQDVALCASIALLSKAVDLVLMDEKIDLETRNKISQILTQSYGFEGLAAGQFVDLKLKRKNIDFNIVEFINAKKTAALFTAAGKAGALIGKASTEQIKAIEDFSENIGFAFQIVDDILDVVGETNVVGKDLEHDKMNFVMLVGKEEAEKQAKEYTEKALRALDIFGDKANELKALSDFLIKRVS
ncbi:MAG: polyprenyl synthetase family protein [Calditrichaeota bacterium]|nr:MAG: polyprenyl synthetase family protein [Calditrichota bacterium]MBL1206329.1 polyprenyl synthetase family protein [Calditrichota bacterium]NOG46155.1 polyprenyl synthetase family protein [Calditrichota bacterium]